MTNTTIYYAAKFVKISKPEKVLFIFPQLPCWLIATHKLTEVLEFFSDGQTISEFYKKLNISNETEISMYKNLFDALVSKKILSTIDNDTFPLTDNPKSKINHFIFGITNGCNLRCLSCYNSYERELQNELTIDEMKKMVDEVIPFLSYGFSVSGGEPFCRKKELFELIEYVSQKAPTLPIGIVTNGTLITDEDAYRLSKIKNLTVQVSLDGVTKESHEFNRGAGTFDKVVNALKVLTHHGVNVLLGVLLTEKSVHEIQQTLDFAIALNIQDVRFIEMFWQGMSRSHSMKRPLLYEIFPIYKHLLTVEPRYRDILKKDTTKIIFDSLAHPVKKKCCGVDNRAVFIDSDGSVYPCNLLIAKKYLMGNIRENSFRNIWLNSEVKSSLCELSVEMFNKCRVCEIRYLCGGGCRGTAFNATGNIMSPPPNCDEKKRAIYAYLWEFAEDNSLYRLLNGEEK